MTQILRRLLPVALLAIVALSTGACAMCQKSKSSTACCSSGGSCTK